jgi:hypothetical protein
MTTSKRISRVQRYEKLSVKGFKMSAKSGYRVGLHLENCFASSAWRGDLTGRDKHPDRRIYHQESSSFVVLQLSSKFILGKSFLGKLKELEGGGNICIRIFAQRTRSIVRIFQITFENCDSVKQGHKRRNGDVLGLGLGCPLVLDSLISLILDCDPCDNGGHQRHGRSDDGSPESDPRIGVGSHLAHYPRNRARKKYPEHDRQAEHPSRRQSGQVVAFSHAANLPRRLSFVERTATRHALAPQICSWKQPSTPSRYPRPVVPSIRGANPFRPFPLAAVYEAWSNIAPT